MSATGRSRRLPGLVNLAGAVIVLVAVLAIAFRSLAASPPAIAEFAPQVQHQIQQAPQEETAAFGQGSVGAGVLAPSPSPSPAAGVPAGAVLKHCVGDPPRQIEDPQSPPCVALWQGDNGGATARGVSSTAINVAWIYQNLQNEEPNFYADMMSGYLRFFNDRFELYGRKLVFNQFTEIGNAPAQERSNAQAVIQAQMFASTEWGDQGGIDYHAELAKHGVVSTFGFEGIPTNATIADGQPYLWSYSPATESMFATTGEWYCRQLNRKPASHAGPTLSTQPRTLGIVYQPPGSDQQTSLQPLLDSLAACGVKPVVVTQTDDTSAVAQLQSANVSSVICECFFLNWQTLTTYANKAAYFPEWLLNGYGGGDSQMTFHFLYTAPANQAQHALGITFQPRQVQWFNDPAWWAWSEGNPTSPPPHELVELYQAHLFYRSLLELVSGIQMAGPHLNAAAIRDGLHRTVFPNPPSPLQPGAVGFGGGGYTMTLDTAEWWYDPTVQSPYAPEGDSTGALCYVAHGTRWRPGEWPPGDPYGQGPCDSS